MNIEGEFPLEDRPSVLIGIVFFHDPTDSRIQSDSSEKIDLFSVSNSVVIAPRLAKRFNFTPFEGHDDIELER